MSLTKEELASIVNEYGNTIEDDERYKFTKDDIWEVFNTLNSLFGSADNLTVRSARADLGICLNGGGQTCCGCYEDGEVCSAIPLEGAPAPEPEEKIEPEPEVAKKVQRDRSSYLFG